MFKYELELQYTEIKNEIYRLVPTDKGYSKVSLASLSDYYYKIPPELKETYLASFFIPRKIENESISIMPTDYNVTTN